jgi:hypothetical protein
MVDPIRLILFIIIQFPFLYLRFRIPEHSNQSTRCRFNHAMLPMQPLSSRFLLPPV